ncbi:sugar O-acetyltransferase [Methanobrevibacter sp. DSM 116169]|uniref:sugar O-acetyltransferase n=1 Tax=Methanobrevibacter sp. DSM 116169 TaxID=3242727 RepID=UPI0038FCEABF
MTNKNGKIFYNSKTDENLLLKISKTKEICFKYNNLSYDDFDNKKEIIKNLFNKTGENFNIEPVFWCDIGSNISIGENFFMNHNCVILDTAPVEFGDNVFIGPNCGFYTAEHMLNPTERNEGLEYSQNIKIGNNVWIGGSSTILSGVTIGDNSVIGAGSVVTQDIPSNVIGVGNPCKVIKNIPK